MEINEYLVKLFQAIKDLEGLDLFAGSTKLSRTEFRLLREIIMEGQGDHLFRARAPSRRDAVRCFADGDEDGGAGRRQARSRARR